MIDFSVCGKILSVIDKQTVINNDEFIQLIEQFGRDKFKEGMNSQNEIQMLDDDERDEMVSLSLGLWGS